MSDAPPPGRRILPPVYFLASIVAMLALHRFLPGATILPVPWRYLGLAPLLAGLALTLGAARLFARSGTAIKPFQESSALVLDGPYRYTRNPMYTGLIGMLTGIAMLLGAATPLAVVPLFAVILHRRFVRREEAMLLRTFGRDYALYKERVRRWI